MVLRKLVCIFIFTLMISPASIATADHLPFLTNSTYVRAYVGVETAVMFNTPNGSGSAFTAASIGGSLVDATITLTLLDHNMVPFANFPFEDCWIESADDGLVACTGGSTADANTNAIGETTWATPLAAGGSSEALTVVVVSGYVLTSTVGVAISHNSADINGDGAINLTDVPLFADDFYSGSYAFRSDFAYDGDVNLSDVVKFAQVLGANCP